MRFGIFYEHQLPRPWAPGDEHRLLADALEQVKLADRVGIDYLWEAERHLAPFAEGQLSLPAVHHTFATKRNFAEACAVNDEWRS
jgi:alkanesulfonate monooxygenase SsuD/methylene tetrahydromethanopterin reductase-like flavin-dependent oxidoreductase (luciferase family)